MKKKIANREPLFTRYLIQIMALGAVAFFMIMVGSYKPSSSPVTPSQVLGVKTHLADKNANANTNVKSDSMGENKVEVTDTPEPKDTPEPTDMPEPDKNSQNEREAEKVHNEIKQKVQNRETEQVELQSMGEGSDSGKVLLKNKEKTTLELNSPVSSTTAVMNLTTANAGEVSVHFKPNGILINNGPYQVMTQFPVLINPVDNTLSIRTPSGVTIIKTFPVQALDNLPSRNKFSAVSSITLEQQQGELVYQVDGVQVKKLLGIISVPATVSQQISAQTGQVVSSQLPWYYSLFGFAFKNI